MEVNFIVGDTAFEVKGTAHISARDLKGLKAIATEGAFAHRVVVCREPLPFMKDGIEILPFAVFIERLWGGDFGLSS